MAEAQQNGRIYKANDYVYSKADLQKFKDKVFSEAAKLKKERKENEGLQKQVDETKEAVVVVKEQILDLNDKFDYLISIMLKS